MICPSILHWKANQLGGVSVGWAKHGGILNALGPYQAMGVKQTKQVPRSYLWISINHNCIYISPHVCCCATKLGVCEDPCWMATADRRSSWDNNSMSLLFSFNFDDATNWQARKIGPWVSRRYICLTLHRLSASPIPKPSITIIKLWFWGLTWCEPNHSYILFWGLVSFCPCVWLHMQLVQRLHVSDRHGTGAGTNSR